MAFTGKSGQRISFECTELIEELKQDIIEFGGNTIVKVVTQQYDGVILYKDYNFIEDDENTAFKLTEEESITQMTMTALLTLYEEENKLF